MDPPVPQRVNGVPDAFSHPFFDDFISAAALTNFTAPPFPAADYVMVANGICASTCAIVASYLSQKHGVRSAVFGGTPSATTAQVSGGVKGSELTKLGNVLAQLELTGLADDPAAPQPFPVAADLSLNFRNAIPYVHKEDGILEYVVDPATKKYQFTRELVDSPERVWEFVAEEFFGRGH
jgi:hypothetical protein